MARRVLRSAAWILVGATACATAPAPEPTSSPSTASSSPANPTAADASAAPDPEAAVETAERVNARKYTRRGGGCEIALYHTAVPGASAWDDLGIAEAACNVSTPLSQCLQQLKAEACRMGGDMVYNVPRSPLRPADQVMLFRGQVAHSRPGKQRKSEADEKDQPPPASQEESSGPIVPLTGPSTRAPASKTP